MERLPATRGKVPEVRRKGEVGQPGTLRRSRSRFNAFTEFAWGILNLRRLPKLIDEEELQHAAIGALTCLVAAVIATQLPAPAAIRGGSFDVFGVVTQQVSTGADLAASLVQLLKAGHWPLLVLGTLGLLVDAYLAVRPRQPIAWHYFCAAQMLLGFLASLALVGVVLVLLLNIFTGLLLAAIVVVFGAIAVAIVGSAFGLFRA